MSTIHWRPWDAAARAAAFDGQKLMLIYCHSALDHWSNLWMREIEAHAELSASIDAVCIPIKICVDEEPELATRVQEVLAVTSGSQGWPAIAWLTPNGNPLGATPYRPLLDGETMRGFAPMFIDVVEAWFENRSALESDVEDMRQAWRFYEHIDRSKNMKDDLLSSALEAHIMHHADTLEGGFGEAPRDLPITLLEFLLSQMQRGTAAPSLAQHTTKTLNALIAGGVYDHLQGGFFRGSTDAAWCIPFFEKRCSDQARIIPLLYRASAITGESLYAECADACLQFVRDYLCDDDGLCVYGFEAESIGADKRIVNGAAYTWSLSAIADLIGADAAAIIAKRYMSDERSFIDDTFAHFAMRGEVSERERDALPAWCHRLMAARLERPQARRDERKTILNQALMLLALQAALVRKEQQDLRAWADTLALFLQDAQATNNNEAAFAGWALANYNGAQMQDQQRAAIERFAAQLQAGILDNGFLAVTAEPIFADSVILSSDTADCDSALVPCLLLWRFLAWHDQADALLQAYKPLIKEAPMAHASIIAQFDQISAS